MGTDTACVGCKLEDMGRKDEIIVNTRRKVIIAAAVHPYHVVPMR